MGLKQTLRRGNELSTPQKTLGLVPRLNKIDLFYYIYTMNTEPHYSEKCC